MSRLTKAERRKLLPYGGIFAGSGTCIYTVAGDSILTIQAGAASAKIDLTKDPTALLQFIGALCARFNLIVRESRELAAEVKLDPMPEVKP